MKRQIRTIAIAMALRMLAVAAPQAQAFVPSLQPVHRVDPVYPAAARQQNAYGTVEVLVTFDPAGKVTEAEVLQGPAVLRQATVDAVKQWTFRPVIHEGRPVYAMTSVMVQVMPPQERGAPRLAPRLEFDAKEAAAAGQRLAELRKQFPRSSAQVLADEEQQTAGDRGAQRFYDLPRLAKAAYGAGDVEKARALATELLRMAPEYRGDWNYGNAIHDGNMVLGLVALRNGNPADATNYIREAGKTPGSPQLNSFGPNMMLAKELIDAGQGAAVLEYFEECRVFWKMGGKRLDEWSATVRGGGKPAFGANLLY